MSATELATTTSYCKRVAHMPSNVNYTVKKNIKLVKLNYVVCMQ